MEMTNVQSSNVDSVGYLEAERVLLIRYKDGSLYARVDVQPETMQAFESATSKGRFLAQLTNPAVKIAVVNPAQGATPKAETQSAEQGANAPLQTYQDDQCCARGLVSFLLTPQSGSAQLWTCRKCGQEWSAHRHGDVRHWEPIIETMVMRPNR